MHTHSGLAKRIKDEWRVTNHALDRLGDRGIAASELIDMLLDRTLRERQFGVADDGKELFCRWNDHIGIVYYYGVDYETGDSVKVIITVQLQANGKKNWERDALLLAGKRRELSIIDLDALHDWAVEATSAPEPKYKPKKKPPVAPVTIRNHYDRVPPELMRTARKLLKANGLDQEDMRAVVILGPNRIEIDPTRLRGARRVG